MTYHKPMTGSVPLCPLMFSCHDSSTHDSRLTDSLTHVYRKLSGQNVKLKLIRRTKKEQVRYQLIANSIRQEAVTTACTRGFNIFAKFCCRQSKLLQSTSRILVHFTVVKSQATLTIRLGVTEVISAITLYLPPAFLPRWICPGFVTGFRLCNRAGNSEHRKHK